MQDNAGLTPIGITNYYSTNQKFGILDKDWLSHIYVIGKTGVGKSTPLLNMAISDIECGNGICVIDPHGDIAEDLLNYIPLKGRDYAICLNCISGKWGRPHHIM